MDVYIKLVNADGIDKAIKLELKDINAAPTGKRMTLTGDSALVHIPNINKKNDEKVVPSEAVIQVDDGLIFVNLAANSVNVIVLDVV
ncbi:alpha-L-arabinofuranosidase [Paenibacillus castaneae]|uniref:hypothetical protein n=1 Tax=Paenibacillus castaneae TaxID=474957 RepID=UPI000C9CD8E5|nr:hypothetical protein [Paenibacillus castaneae]NIK78521.1 alpha-L-arabinofuranosidase [Paenibacillus castaneae]